MSHLKRQAVPRSWPIVRKGTTFVVRPLFNLEKGIPLLIFLRDMLKLAQNRREVKKALHSKHILINGKIAKDEKQSVILLDIITIVPLKKNYKLTLNEKGKFSAEEVNNANFKISKIINKKILRGKKIQINLMDGRNYLYNLKCKVNDSAIIDLKENKISKILALDEKSKVFVFAGKYSGTIGIINKIKENMAEINTEKEKINVLIKQLMVIE